MSSVNDYNTSQDDEDQFPDFDEFDEGSPHFVKELFFFIIDGTPEMFQNDAAYFKKCILMCRRLVAKQCSYNIKDKFGLIILGTNDSAGFTNVIQFSNITLDSLEAIQHILENIDIYSKRSSQTAYPLHDALLIAMKSFLEVKATVVKCSKKIILLTCNDNPLSNDPVEKRRVETLASSFPSSNLEFHVIGLNENWADDYYKELQIISGTYTSVNYKKKSFDDILKEILFHAKSISTLKWRIHGNDGVLVKFFNLHSKTKFPRKVLLNKETDEPVYRHTVYRPIESFDFNDDPSIKDSSKPVITTQNKNIKFCKEIGGSVACFTKDELTKLNNMGRFVGVKTIAFKKVHLDPIDHERPAYFVTCDHTTNSEDQKEFFKGLVSKLCDKNLMAICSVATKRSFKVYSFVPDMEGGFYAYLIPCRGQIRNLHDMEKFQRNIYDSKINPPPIDEGTVTLFKKLLAQNILATISPVQFKNPKLEKMLSHIEALAFESDLNDSEIKDDTLPPNLNDIEDVQSQLKIILNLNDAIGDKRKASQQASSHSKKPKYDIEAMQLVVQNGQTKSKTVAELKEFLKSVGESTVGTKNVLIDRINKYFDK